MEGGKYGSKQAKAPPKSHTPGWKATLHSIWDLACPRRVMATALSSPICPCRSKILIRDQLWGDGVGEAVVSSRALILTVLTFRDDWRTQTAINQTRRQCQPLKMAIHIKKKFWSSGSASSLCQSIPEPAAKQAKASSNIKQSRDA